MTTSLLPSASPPAPSALAPAPLSSEQMAAVQSLARSLSPGQVVWVSRFLLESLCEGALARDELRIRGDGSGEQTAKQTESAAARPAITVLFGTETGHAEQIARRLVEEASAAGLPVALHSLSEYEPSWLKREKLVLLIVSTHGDGDPPGPARRLYEFLRGPRAPKLDHLRFAVLALGDRTYAHFCKTGRSFDERLAALGGSRLLERVECDVDFEPSSAGWIADSVAALRAALPPAVVPVATASDGSASPGLASNGAARHVSDRASRSEFARTPIEAEVLQNQILSGRGSTKEVRHLELSWSGPGTGYEPGDSLSVLSRNDSTYVEALARAAGLELTEVVPTPRGILPLAAALEQQFEVRLPSRSQLRKYALLGAPTLGALMANDESLASYLDGRELLDVIRDFPVPNLSAERFVATLNPLAERRYSIASCADVFPDEVHLMVSVVRYQAQGRSQRGVASGFLAEQASPGQSVSAYVCPNQDFRLPKDPGAPVLMIGPGTGVAPFRAFLQKRKAYGMRGPTWLFFGDRTFLADFSYQVEWQRMVKEGVLTRMDVAFSRERDGKHYVQHRLAERARDVYDWLERGAHVYVCGDRLRMARDVDDALAQLISQVGNVSMEAARSRLDQMKSDKRYLRDVY